MVTSPSERPIQINRCVRTCLQALLFQNLGISMSSKMGGRLQLIADPQILYASISMGVEQTSMNGAA